jgi:hypothetical protein
LLCCSIYLLHPFLLFFPQFLLLTFLWWPILAFPLFYPHTSHVTIISRSIRRLVDCSPPSYPIQC